MAEVKAPNSAYNGPGPGGADFVNGVADVEDEAALNYYRGAGYTVDGDVDTVLEVPEPPDPREVGEVVGSRLRDAAVDPEPDDYLPPTNAGQDNPHGSTVVSPEIHASGPKGIRPGVVAVDDVDLQGKAETEYAEARLVDQATAATAVETVVPDLDERGELDLSDPGSAAVGREAAERIAAEKGAAMLLSPEDAGFAADEGKPAKSDAKAAWVDYAVTQGADRDEAEARTKADLVETYGG